MDRARLLRMAARAGVAESARFVSRAHRVVPAPGTPGGYSPDRLLERTGAALAAPASAVAGLHVFTFNQIQQTEQWRRAAGPGRDLRVPGPSRRSLLACRPGPRPQWRPLKRQDSHLAEQMVERAAELARDSHARTRHAAVLVKDGSLLAWGTNGVPFPGEDHCYCKFGESRPS